MNDEIYKNVLCQMDELLRHKNIEAEWLIVDNDTLVEIRSYAEQYIVREGAFEKPGYLKFNRLKISVACCPKGERVLEVR